VSPRPNSRAWALTLLLACAVAGAAWGVVATPLGPEEAKAIFLGRAVLAAGPPACPPAAGAAGEPAAAPCGWPGSVVLVPAVAAWAEGRGGLAGARLGAAATGILLVLVVHRVASGRRWGRRGLLAAATFVALGVPLQLLSTVHPRVLAAALLGLAVLLAEAPGEGEAARRGAWPLAALGGAALAVAVAASYPAAVFALPLAVAIAAARRDRAAAAFVLALAAALAAYGWAAVRPAWPELRNALGPLPPGGWAGLPARLVVVLDGLAMPLLLSAFALFDRESRGAAAAAMAVACAAFLVPLASARMGDEHTARLLACAVLAPAVGVGVDRMARIFASGNPSPRARPLFTAAVLAVIAAFGVHETRALRRDGPDLSAAIAFLRADGAGGRTLLVESDYGSPELVYRYYLEAASPPARVVPLARADASERSAALRSARPDYVVLDEHHSDRSFGTASREYLAQGFSLAASYRMPLGSGARSVHVLRREAR
jgi:hypothetical protein